MGKSGVEGTRIISAVWFHAIIALCLHIMALLIFLVNGYFLASPMGIAMIALIALSAVADLIIYLETRERMPEIFERPVRDKPYIYGASKEAEAEPKIFDQPKEIGELPPPPPELLVPGLDGRITCPICRSSVDARVKFCPSCGARLKW